MAWPPGTVAVGIVFYSQLTTHLIPMFQALHMCTRNVASLVRRRCRVIRRDQKGVFGHCMT